MMGLLQYSAQNMSLIMQIMQMYTLDLPQPLGEIFLLSASGAALNFISSRLSSQDL